MKVLIRKTVAGTEYWDTEGRRSIFVPRGQEPDFEVVENPKSMLTPEEDKAIVSYDESNIKDKIVVTDNIDIVESQVEQELELDNMNTKDLRAYAKKNNIDIPAAFRAKGDIVQLIKETLK